MTIQFIGFMLSVLLLIICLLLYRNNWIFDKTENILDQIDTYNYRLMLQNIYNDKDIENGILDYNKLIKDYKDVLFHFWQWDKKDLVKKEYRELIK